MNASSPSAGRPLNAVGAALALAFTFAGCGKKEEPAAATEAVAPEAAATAEATPEPAAERVEAASEVQGTIQEADTALKQHDYTKAADALLKMKCSGAVQTEDQAVAHYQRMTDLNRQIAEALVSGDPNAKRAAELLMRARGR